MESLMSSKALVDCSVAGPTDENESPELTYVSPLMDPLELAYLCTICGIIPGKYKLIIVITEGYSTFIDDTSPEIRVSRCLHD